MALTCASALAQSVAIGGITPAAPLPGNTIGVRLTAAYTSNSGKTAPSGCMLTLIPYQQGNAPSIIGSIPVSFVPLPGGIFTPARFAPADVTATIPATTPLGNYALELNCSSAILPAVSGLNGRENFVWAEKDVAIGGPPSVAAVNPASAAMGQTVRVTGVAFRSTPGFVVLTRQGGYPAPTSYITGSGITKWTDGEVDFTLPDSTVPTGSFYQVQVQTADNGISAANNNSLLQIVPLFPGWADLHTHPMSYLGFGGKLIYGGVDEQSWLPPEQASADVMEKAILAGSVSLDTVLAQLGPGGWAALPVAITGEGVAALAAQVWAANEHCFTTGGGTMQYNAVNGKTYTLPVAATAQDALGHENMVHGGWDPINNPCGDAIRQQVIAGIQSNNPGSPALSEPATNYVVSGFQNVQAPQGQMDFTTWPAWNDLVDQRMWWQWIQRANQGGQRVLVALTVNNKTLGDATAGANDLPTDDQTSTDLQIDALQAFVVRHSSFMGIALTPQDVQTLTMQGKTAVIIGTEVDAIGNDYAPVAGKDMDTALVNEIKRLHDKKGVRYIFPIHLVDNISGGAAAYDPKFNLATWYETGQWMSLQCASQMDQINITALDPTGQTYEAAMLLKENEVPWPGPTMPSCATGIGYVNTRGLSGTGAKAIVAAMNLGMLIDIDHMSEQAANDTIQLAILSSPLPYPYPLMSGHNGVRSLQSTCTGGSCPPVVTSERSLTAAQYSQLGKIHGMAGVGSAQLTADQWLALYTKVTLYMADGGAGFGTDMDGMEFGMPPRKNSNVNSLYGTSSLPPASTMGTRTWKYDSDGVAHYGMLPDYLQDVRSLTPLGPGAVNNMFAGAQYFYETWRLAMGQVPLAGPAPTAPAPAGNFAANASNGCPGIEVLDPGSSTWGGLAGSATPAPSCVCPSGDSFANSGAAAGTCVIPPPSPTNSGGPNVCSGVRCNCGKNGFPACPPALSDQAPTSN